MTHTHFSEAAYSLLHIKMGLSFLPLSTAKIDLSPTRKNYFLVSHNQKNLVFILYFQYEI